MQEKLENPLCTICSVDPTLQKIFFLLPTKQTLDLKVQSTSQHSSQNYVVCTLGYLLLT